MILLVQRTDKPACNDHIQNGVWSRFQLEKLGKSYFTGASDDSHTARHTNPVRFKSTYGTPAAMLLFAVRSPQPIHTCRTSIYGQTRSDVGNTLRTEPVSSNVQSIWLLEQ